MLWMGLIVGSFLNVCIYRLPQNKSIIRPPSHCIQCNMRLHLCDLVPVISYLFLRGKCRYCGTSVPPRYVVVEIITGVLFLWCFQVVGLGPELIKVLTFTSFLIVITFIDYDHQLILDKVLIWFFVAGVGINLYIGYPTISDMLTASLTGGGLLLIIAVITRGGMGGGDIKFVAALGLWLGLKLTLLTLFLSFIIGGIGGALLLLLKLKSRKDFIPFGPFIALGAFVSMMYGYDLIRWYFYISR
ncbi:prepilin peptidase [Sporomusa sp.]|uniref:prepilin peptidase n=1 Tax=Sporomusa sp. TaxID=2078658 RepID=UPI002C7CAF3B|nr:prepilin peptidase [Sporomusa sp.]HWR43651.1 prepilin peptidase [Sporomusa sp.]